MWHTIYIASVNFYILISLSWLTSTPVAAAHSMFFATATLPLLFPYHITPTVISYLSPLPSYPNFLPPNFTYQ